MTRRLAAWMCAMVLAMPAVADWRETLTSPKPGNFAPPAPLEARYRFGWGAVTAAEARFDFSRPKGGQLQLKMDTKTIGVVRGIWRMDAKHTAWCDAATLRPIALQQTESYRDETLKTEAKFSSEGVMRKQERIPAETTRAKDKRFKCPDLFDLHTALLFVRSQPLRPDDVYRIVVYPAKAPYLATVRVVGTERIKAAGQEYPAIKLELELQRVTKNLELESHKKFKRAAAWISDDRERLLLKIKSEVFVGSVWAELESVKFRDTAMRRNAVR
jgi:Protein of unknown function (DUF3108)